jgi:hypothetical protein
VAIVEELHTPDIFYEERSIELKTRSVNQLHEIDGGASEIKDFSQWLL